MKATLLGVAWMLATTCLFMLIGYLPGAAGLVDDYKWGRLIGGIFVLPGLPALLTASVFFARGRRRHAFWIAGLLLAGLVLLDVIAIIVHLKR